MVFCHEQNVRQALESLYMQISIVKCKGLRKDCLGEFYIFLFTNCLGDEQLTR
jgi:hypothetical protein